MNDHNWKLDDGTPVHLSSQRGLKDLTDEFADVIYEYEDPILRAFQDMRVTLEKVDIILVHRTEGARARWKPGNVIIIKAERFVAVKQNCTDLETAHKGMAHILLQELAYFKTPDEKEADNLASEWCMIPKGVHVCLTKEQIESSHGNCFYCKKPGAVEYRRCEGCGWKVMKCPHCNSTWLLWISDEKLAGRE